MKQRAVVVGNCQAEALAILLRANDEFCRHFEIVSLPPVHELTAAEIPAVHREVAGSAVAILQRVDDGYRDGLGVGTGTLTEIAGAATVVRWPSVFWAGYVPDLFYLRDRHGQPVVDGPFDYHDRSVLRAYAEGLSVEQACHRLADPDVPSDAPALAAAATAELKVRGEDCDVQVTSLIENRFRDDLLFFTMNHPANRVIGYLAQQITDLLGLRGGVDSRRIPNELLDSTFYPLHANHARALSLRFGSQLAPGGGGFKIRGTVHDAPDAVQLFYDYYEAHPDLVGLNGP